MPILTSNPPAGAQVFRVVLPDGTQLEGIHDTYPKVLDLTGWDSLAALDAVLVPSGGGPGSVAVGDWQPREQLYGLSAAFDAPTRTEHTAWRRLLVGNFPADREVAVEVVEDSTTRRLFVRRYDEGTIRYDAAARKTVCDLPLIAPDPFKYAEGALSGQVGVFTGETWFRTYTLAATKWVRSYTLSAGKWVRTYSKATPSGPYPASLTLTSAGDTTSQRVVATVNGPLTAGDWWLVNETTGDRLWVEVAVPAGSSLVLDMRARTARLNGAPVEHLVFGDWLTLAPGANQYRLTSGTASAAWASIEATEAYQ